MTFIDLPALPMPDYLVSEAKLTATILRHQQLIKQGADLLYPLPTGDKPHA